MPDISVSLLLTRDGADVTNQIVANRIANAGPGNYVAVWTASDGTQTATRTASRTDATVQSVPSIIGTISDRAYTVGQTVAATYLRTKFSGATSYVISPAIAQAVIEDHNLVFRTLAAIGDTEITVRGINGAGQSEPLTFNLRVNAAQTAPGVTTAPTITGGTTAGGSWTLAIGAATGNPAPNPTRLWRVNDQVQNNQSGETFSKPGLSAGDEIRGGVRWSNSQGEVTVWSEPIILTVQPQIIATISPNPLVAGQQAGITFNTAIDGAPTIAQGQTVITATRVGQTNEWRFTPVAAGPLIVGATATGYTSSPWTFDVQPAPPQIIVTSAQTGAVRNVDGTTPAFDYEITAPSPAAYRGKRTVVPAQMLTGPIAHVPPIPVERNQPGRQHPRDTRACRVLAQFRVRRAGQS